MTGDLLVLVESNTTGTGRLFPAAARDLGLRPVLLAADPARYPSAGGAEVVPADTADLRQVIATCRRLARGTRIAGITTSSEYFVATASAAARRLGRPAHPPGVIESIQDKGAQRRLLADAGVRVPRFSVAGTGPAAVAAADRIGYPVVIKPVTGSGSSGVRLCADAAEVSRQAAVLLARGRNERGRPVPRRLLVEEFVSGAEYSVEVFGDTVVGIVRKHLGAPPGFVEIGHDFPAPLGPAARDRLAATALAAVRALGLTHGPAHVELRGAAPVIIEVNPRLAGGWIPRLVREAAGIDLIRETVLAWCGDRPVLDRPVLERTALERTALDRTARGAAAIRFVLAPRGGVLVGFTGVAEARRQPHVADVAVYREPGTTIEVGGDFRDRIGHVLACADTVRAAADAAAAGLRQISPVIDDLVIDNTVIDNTVIDDAVIDDPVNHETEPEVASA